MNFQPKQISTIVQVILENGFTWMNSITYTSLFISHAVHAFAYRIYHIKSKGCYFIALTAVLVGKHSFSFLSEKKELSLKNIRRKVSYLIRFCLQTQVHVKNEMLIVFVY